LPTPPPACTLDVTQGCHIPTGSNFAAKLNYEWTNTDLQPNAVTSGASLSAANKLSCPDGHTLVFDSIIGIGTTGSLVTFESAAEACFRQQKRLPLLQELYDFCWLSSGQSASDGWSGFGECGGQILWSAEVSSSNHNFAWLFNGGSGYLLYLNRYLSHNARCVLSNR
jgi:hypothetical protein